MAFNAEAEVKALRTRVDGLERKIDSLEKTLRALPDLTAIGKLAPRLDAAEKAIAGKKDAKTADQEASKANAKLAADVQAMSKEHASKVMIEARFKVLEAQIANAMALAGGKR